jgi:hypothetical protein
MVCTFAAITPSQTHNWDIILLADPTGAAGTKSVWAMSQFHGPAEQENHRVYSFRMPGLRLGRRGRLRLEAMAGETIYHLAPQRAGVRVLWLPSDRSRGHIGRSNCGEMERSGRRKALMGRTLTATADEYCSDEPSLSRARTERRPAPVGRRWRSPSRSARTSNALFRFAFPA